MRTATAAGRRFRSMSEVRRANASAGQHFFARATAAFFDSRVESRLVRGRYFVTSEQFHPSTGEPDPRRYTLREALPSGYVTTVGDFQQYDTADAALAAARSCPHE